MKIVIVQARVGSSRLAGKILLPLGRGSALACVLTRCACIPGIDAVLCAVPDTVSSEPIAAVAREYGAILFRGSEHDVLDRHHRAAREVGASVVMRVTSDCPLVDPALCGEVLGALETAGADYVCNNMPPLWPHGLDCDVFPVEHLARAAREATSPYDREHVTPWLRRNLRAVAIDGPGGGLEQHRWTLDYPEDYALFRALWDVLGERAGEASVWECIAALEAHPEIASLNRAFIDRQRLDDRSVAPGQRMQSRFVVPSCRADAA
jgi:spore coat polysaccharide biosynthesis protein SpsF (cytidylyltransferase family)